MQDSYIHICVEKIYMYMYAEIRPFAKIWAYSQADRHDLNFFQYLINNIKIMK